MTEQIKSGWLAKYPAAREHVMLKIALALLPAVIFIQNYGWMTANAYLGWAFLIIWAVMIWSLLQLAEKNSILERVFRLAEIGFFLLPLSALIMTFVLGSKIEGGSSLEQAGAAIGMAIGGAFVVGVGFAAGIAGGIIMHLVASKYEKKAEASGVKPRDEFSNRHGVVLAIAAVFLLAVVLGSVAAAKNRAAAQKEKEGLQSGGSSLATPASDNKEKISLEILKKGFQASNWQAGVYEDQITMTLKLTNGTDRDVRGVQGIVVFYDIFGGQIDGARISYDEGLAVGSSTVWEAYLDYNPYIDEKVKLRNTALENLKFKWEVNAIVYADGSTENP